MSLATVKKVSFALSPSQAAPSGRERLEQLIGSSFYTETWPANGLAKYIGEIVKAGHNMLQETQSLSTNLKDLGNGMKSGKFKSDLSDTEMDWMDEFTKQLEDKLHELEITVDPASIALWEPGLNSSTCSKQPFLCRR